MSSAYLTNPPRVCIPAAAPLLHYLIASCLLNLFKLCWLGLCFWWKNRKQWRSDRATDWVREFRLNVEERNRTAVIRDLASLQSDLQSSSCYPVCVAFIFKRRIACVLYFLAGFTHWIQRSQVLSLGSSEYKYISINGVETPSQSWGPRRAYETDQICMSFKRSNRTTKNNIVICQASNS